MTGDLAGWGWDWTTTGRGQVEERLLPPPDNLGLHMVKGDGDASRLALDYIHNVWFVQHGRGLFQGWALGEENTG